MHCKLSLIHASSLKALPLQSSSKHQHARLHTQARRDSWQSMHRPELMKLGRSSWREGRMSLSDRGPAFVCSDFILASSPRCTRTMISCTMRLSSGQKCLSHIHLSCQQACAGVTCIAVIRQACWHCVDDVCLVCNGR